MSNEYFFQEITCIPDTDISVGYIMGRVMNDLHLALVNAKGDAPHSSIGLSFPGYRQMTKRSKGDPPWVGPPIGNKIRLFARRSGELERGEIDKTLSRFADYIHVRQPIALRRPNLAFATFSRYQPRGCIERQIRRQMKRQKWSQEQAGKHFLGYKETVCFLPYVDMYSHGSENRFRLFIRKQASDESDCWQFSTYGLSAVNAVPDF